MNSYVSQIKDLVEDFENNKINEDVIVNELYYLIDEWNNEITFEPKVRKLIKNYDNYFNSEFGSDVKIEIIEFFNNNVIFHKEIVPKRISFKKDNFYFYIDNEKLSKFLEKLSFNEMKKLENDEYIFYIWRLK